MLLGAAACFVGAVIDSLVDRDDLYVAAATVFVAFTSMSWAWASTARRDSLVSGE